MHRWHNSAPTRWRERRDSHRAWQRGNNENTYGLLQQYLPKGTDVSGFNQIKFGTIAWQINTRPRKSLDWKYPTELLMPKSTFFVIINSLHFGLETIKLSYHTIGSQCNYYSSGVDVRHFESGGVGVGRI